jgi:uncharacterized membrane protein
MRINEEQVMKLNQLDRIEFRQRYKILKDKDDEDGYCFNFAGKISLILGFLLIIATMFLTSGYMDIAKNFLVITLLIFKLSLFMFIIFLIIDLIFSIKYMLSIKKLIQEYFTQEIKSKKRRGNN